MSGAATVIMIVLINLKSSEDQAVECALAPGQGTTL